MDTKKEDSRKKMKNAKKKKIKTKREGKRWRGRGYTSVVLLLSPQIVVGDVEPRNRVMLTA